MSYEWIALISVMIFASVHLWAEKTSALGYLTKSKLLSTGGGVSIAYVFIDLLPKLSKNDVLINERIQEIFPYFERHVYVMALLGFLLFFTIDRSQLFWRKQSTYFWLSLSSYTLFNFLVGYAIADQENPEVKPLFLFTFAIALHYLMNDYSLSQAHGDIYRYFGKWVLIFSLFAGWLVGVWIELSATSVALVSAFIGGGIIMNVTRHELPSENPNSLSAFLWSAFIYTLILLAIGTD